MGGRLLMHYPFRVVGDLFYAEQTSWLRGGAVGC